MRKFQMENKPWEKWSDKKIEKFQKDFLTWYQSEKRNLPWRADQDPYHVWISEIMLQQTRVDTVIGYYYRFMEQFPSIQSLAESDEQKLLKVWEGLGYYSRARNMKVAAQQIVKEHNGQFPTTVEDIKALKGVGPYTAGAIASIAFQLPEPAIDGNVMRVVSRLFGITDDIAKSKSRKTFDLATRKILSQEKPGDMNQAFMDLGSSICTPVNPKCETCPLQAFCFAKKESRQSEFPVKTKKAKPKDQYFLAGIIEDSHQQFLVEQRADQGLLAKMWLFPLEEISKKKYDELKITWEKNEQAQLSLDLVAEEETPLLFEKLPVVWQKRHFGEITHIFSHLKWHVLLFYGRSATTFPYTKGKWLKSTEFNTLVFPKPQQKIWAKFVENKKSEQEL